MEEFTMTANPGVSVDPPASVPPVSSNPVPAPVSPPVPEATPSQPSPAPVQPVPEPAPLPVAPPAPIVESVTPQTMSGVKPPSKSFRAIFLLLLLATLASAGATAYILMSGNKPQVVPQPAVTKIQTKDENPFAAETEITNPFVDTVSAAVTANPFDDTLTSENPFDQFATSNTTVTNTSKSQNPF